VTKIAKAEVAESLLGPLLAERTRLRQSLAVLEKAFGKGVRESSYAAAGQEDFAKYDGWLEAQGLSAGLKETERKIAEIQRGDFAVV